MTEKKTDDSYNKNEAQARFEATLKEAIKTSPHPVFFKKKGEADKFRASSASEETDPPVS